MALSRQEVDAIRRVFRSKAERVDRAIERETDAWKDAMRWSPGDEMESESHSDG